MKPAAQGLFLKLPFHTYHLKRICRVEIFINSKSKEGATTVEYEITVALIAAVIILVVATLGKQINNINK